MKIVAIDQRAVDIEENGFDGHGEGPCLKTRSVGSRMWALVPCFSPEA